MERYGIVDYENGHGCAWFGTGKAGKRLKVGSFLGRTLCVVCG